MSAPHFDLHQFGGRRSWPVKRVHTVTTEQATSYDDFASMQTTATNRRYFIPSWTLDDAKVREVAVARIRNYCTAQSVIVPENADMQQLNDHALKARNSLASSARERDLCEFQQSLVTGHLKATEQGLLGYIIRVIYCAYRLGMSSVEIAQELNHKASPLQIRQSLHRLNLIAYELYPETVAERKEFYAKRRTELAWERDRLRAERRAQEGQERSQRVRVPSGPSVPNFEFACEWMLRKDNAYITNEELAVGLQKQHALWEMLDCESFESGRIAGLLFGFALHVGAPEAVKAIQQAVGMKRDGVMNEATVVRINSSDRRSVCKALKAAAEGHYRQLSTRSDEASRLVKTWLTQLEFES
jgi:hypothetical protein